MTKAKAGKKAKPEVSEWRSRLDKIQADQAKAGKKAKPATSEG